VVPPSNPVAASVLNSLLYFFFMTNHLVRLPFFFALFFTPCSGPRTVCATCVPLLPYLSTVLLGSVSLISMIRIGRQVTPCILPPSPSLLADRARFLVPYPDHPVLGTSNRLQEKSRRVSSSFSWYSMSLQIFFLLLVSRHGLHHSC